MARELRIVVVLLPRVNEGTAALLVNCKTASGDVYFFSSSSSPDPKDRRLAVLQPLDPAPGDGIEPVRR